MHKLSLKYVTSHLAFEYLKILHLAFEYAYSSAKWHLSIPALESKSFISMLRWSAPPGWYASVHRYHTVSLKIVVTKDSGPTERGTLKLSAEGAKLLFLCKKSNGKVTRSCPKIANKLPRSIKQKKISAFGTNLCLENPKGKVSRSSKFFWRGFDSCAVLLPGHYLQWRAVLLKMRLY